MSALGEAQAYLLLNARIGLRSTLEILAACSLAPTQTRPTVLDDQSSIGHSGGCPFGFREKPECLSQTASLAQIEGTTP
jgi:hypothetical protein